MSVIKIITWQEIAEVFTIIDGELWRLPSRFKLKRVPTNKSQDGYIKVGCKGHLYQYHRLIYMLHHQVTLTAEQVIDHINRNKSDNRIENLQVLSQADNCKKDVVYKIRKRNKFGKFELTIGLNYKTIHLGKFVDESDYWTAHAKKQRLFGVGTKGLAFAQTLNKADAREFVQLAMVA